MHPGGGSVLYVRATRTRLLRAVRTGGTGQLAPGAPRTVRTPYAYQPRPCYAYVPRTVWCTTGRMELSLTKVLKRQGQDATQRSGWQLGLSGKIV